MSDDAHHELRERLRALVDGPAVGARSDDDLLRTAALVGELGRVIDAARLPVAGEIADRSRRELAAAGLASRRGCRGADELLERVTRVSGATARSRMRTALPLRGRVGLTGAALPAPFPAVAAGLEQGNLGLDAAAAIVAALAPLAERTSAADLAAAERELVDAASGTGDAPAVGADEIAIMARTWALYLDPDGTLPDDAHALRHRSLTLGRAREGVVRLTGELLPEVAAQLQRLLDAFLNPKVSDAPGPRFTPDPDDSDAPLDPRTAPQRRHDAFAGILSISAGVEGMPLLGGAPPTLVVTVAADQLGRAAGAAFLPGDGGTVRAAVAAHTGCAGQIQRVVLAPGGRIVELGSVQRIFPAAHRRALAARDGGCVIPGCHVPAAWCEVHHADEHARGGATHTDNGVLLCWFHHRTIDTGGWEIRMIRGAPWVKAPRWLDPSQRWRAASGAPGRRLDALSGAPPG